MSQGFPGEKDTMTYRHCSGLPTITVEIYRRPGFGRMYLFAI